MASLAFLPFLMLFTLANANLFNLLKAHSESVPNPSFADKAAHNAESLAKVRNVVDVVNLVYHMPPCNKIATSMLMNSCSSSLETTSSALDSLGTLYGTRLAVCELYNAGAEIPSACANFVPAPELVRKANDKGLPAGGALQNSGLGSSLHDAETLTASKKCTYALFQKPQSWTSFSNSKQNSLAICQAMRVEIDKDELISILADVKIHSSEFNETAYSSLLTMQRLHELAVESQQFHAETNAAILKAADALAARLKKTADDVSEVSTSAIDTSLKLADIESQFDVMMQQVMQQMGYMHSDAAAARKNMAGLGEGLMVIGRQLEDTHRHVMLMEKTTLAYIAMIEDNLSFLQNIPEPALQFMQTVSDSVKYLTNDAAHIYMEGVKIATAFAVALGSALAVFPIYRYKGGCSLLASLIGSTGFGMAYSAFHLLIKHSIDMLEREGMAKQPVLAMIAVAIASAGAGIGWLLSKGRAPYSEQDEESPKTKHLPTHTKDVF